MKLRVTFSISALAAAMASLPPVHSARAQVTVDASTPGQAEVMLMDPALPTFPETLPVQADLVAWAHVGPATTFAGFQADVNLLSGQDDALTLCLVANGAASCSGVGFGDLPELDLVDVGIRPSGAVPVEDLSGGDVGIRPSGALPIEEVGGVDVGIRPSGALVATTTKGELASCDKCGDVGIRPSGAQVAISGILESVACTLGDDVGIRPSGALVATTLHGSVASCEKCGEVGSVSSGAPLMLFSGDASISVALIEGGHALVMDEVQFAAGALASGKTSASWSKLIATPSLGGAVSALLFVHDDNGGTFVALYDLSVN